MRGDSGETRGIRIRPTFGVDRYHLKNTIFNSIADSLAKSSELCPRSYGLYVCSTVPIVSKMPIDTSGDRKPRPKLRHMLAVCARLRLHLIVCEH